MNLLALIRAVTHWPIAGLRLVWAFGNTWPFKTEHLLATSVGGPTLAQNTGVATKFIITLITAGAIVVEILLRILLWMAMRLLKGMGRTDEQDQGKIGKAVVR